MGYGEEGKGEGFKLTAFKLGGSYWLYFVPHLCTNKWKPSQMNINSYVVFVLIFRYSGGKSEEIIGDMDCLKDSKV